MMKTHRSVAWLVFGLAWVCPAAGATTWHVLGSTGDDGNTGASVDAPLRTIQRAADLAQPGDEIIVHGGIYRERVKPPRGGTSPTKRITYRAQPGERVVITALDPWAPDWKVYENPPGATVYYATPPDSMFSDTHYIDGGNPFRIQYGDKDLSCGQVVVDGVDCTEVSSIPGNPGSWYAERSSGTIFICPETGPPENVEITTRRGVFRPYRKGLGYITVEGFVLEYCGNNAQSYSWGGGPSPQFQSGMIGTRAGHHWEILGNVIRKAKGVGLTFSQGVDKGDYCYDPHGIPRRVDMPNVPGWDNDNELPLGQVIPPWREVGFNRIANNIFEDCGMNAIQGIGSLGNTIYGNRFSNCMQHDFSHWAEDATIKLHLQFGNIIEKNLFSGFTYDHRVLWLDNTIVAMRITRNVFLGKDEGDLPPIYFEIASSPDQYRTIVDNNLFINCVSGFYSGRADGYGIYHNLFLRCGHAFSMGSRRIKGEEDCGATRIAASNNLLVDNGIEGESRAYGLPFDALQNDVTGDYNLIAPPSHYLLVTGGTGNGDNPERPWCSGIDYTAEQITQARKGGTFWDAEETQWGGCGNAPAGCTGDFEAWKATMGNRLDEHSEERDFIAAGHTETELTLHLGRAPEITGARPIRGVGVDFEGQIIGANPKAGPFQRLTGAPATIPFWDHDRLPTLPPPPGPPEEATVTIVSGSTVRLAWSGIAPDALFIRVDRKMNDGPWEFWGFIPTTQPGMEDDALDTTANRYFYRIAARNAGGLSPYCTARPEHGLEIR
jgi:hypothetical protein